MPCQLQFVRYRRPFAIPLWTAQGTWYDREGIILRLEMPDGRVGYGEVAPVDGFGSESLDEAEAYLAQLGTEIDPADVASIPSALRCVRFAIGSAWWQAEEPDLPYHFSNTALLPAGETAVEAAVQALEKGFLSFKTKIGILSVREELSHIDAVLAVLPESATLRVDANGSLDERTFGIWLDALDGQRKIDFIEQPMRVGLERRIREMAAQRDVRVALDESISSLESVETALEDLSWFGPMVLKSPLLGFPAQLMRVVRQTHNSLIFSSVFETGIGLHNGLRLAAAAGARAPVGYGTLAYFSDALNIFSMAPNIDSGEITLEKEEMLWQTICAEFATA